MADTKISALTALTGANLATDDVFPVVETSEGAADTGNKKMTAAELAKGLGPLEKTAVTSPLSAASADTMKTFPFKRVNTIRPAFIGPSGLFRRMGRALDEFTTVFWFPQAGGGSGVLSNHAALTTTGTAGTGTYATTTLAQRLRRVEYTATASASAVVGWRASNGSWGWTVNSTAGLGGFYYKTRVSVLTGVIATQRLFAGMSNVSAHTDVEPSSLINSLGFGWDAADTNIQFMHNDGAGTATKVDTGIAVAAADRDSVYDIELYVAPGSTTIYYYIENLVTAASYSGSATTDYPAAATWLEPYAYTSVGGVSNVIGLSLHGIVIETEY